MTSPPPRDVDELRQRLKALGYLDAGVDRFVLAPARSGRTRITLALVASLRIGILAGLLVGLSGTLAMALRVPSLVTSVREGLAVASVVALLFGFVTMAATFGAIVLASQVVRRLGARVSLHARMRPVALGAGFLVGSACLAYLTLWWNAASASAGMSPTTLVALVIAVAISLMLGHVTTTTALALMAFELDDHLPTAPRVASRRTSVILAGLGLLAASVVVVAITRDARPASAASIPAVTVVPTGLRVVVLGVDGFDPAFARTLARDGGMPTLARILSAPHVDLPRGDGPDPVPLWGSIATGQPPARHGALGLEARRVAGLDRQLPLTSSRLAQAISAATDLLRLTRPTISSGLERRAPAFWEVAARAGLRTAVVNWWTTWPARSDDGTVVSDRAIVRLERGGASEGEIVPVDAHDALARAWPGIRTDAAGRAAAFTGSLSPGPARDAAAHAIELDGLLAAFAGALPPARLDLLTLYLPGLDIAQAQLFAARDRMTPADLALAVRGITTIYASIDDIATRLAADDVTVVFVGHPGRGVPEQSAWMGILAAPSMPVADGATTPAGPSSTATAPALEDVAPTVLALLGVPVADDIRGVPRLDLAGRGFADAHPVRRVSTWGLRATDASAASSPQLDDEARERLRSLGYVR
jgi:hypothetical protein